MIIYETHIHFAFKYAFCRDVAMAIINSKSWKNAMRWRAENDAEGKYTPMKLLITHMPGKMMHDI